ncbi:tripartite tricarboxylate transporter substrate binding protein [Actinotalea sp. Marseille-Q4924]|uniref:Bug family tripartite tricarboxylate transporter substrate binding protein n=1 Tax=Actinotalea sp. Marseille-Q4924 TaxID=2866571 RepID=UPI001CE47B29|nr:tripartite tricarboxylate transporter substrate-binding protein [Actinotalea sp. Marseille-Q4924]
MSRTLTPAGRRRLVALSAAVALPLVLVACSAEDGGSETPDDGGAAAGGETEAPAEAWEPEEDIQWIVPYSPGGGFDTYSRGVAQVMVEEGYLPDGIDVVIRNTPPLPQGITSMFTAEPDGYTVGILPMPAAIAQQIQDPDLARWETEEFTVLGSVDENAYVVYVPADSEFETIEDLVAGSDLRSITVEEGSSSALATAATIEALGLDATVTYGAEGSSEVVAAALRGDAEFFVYGASDVVGFIDSGDVRPLLFLGTEDQRSEELTWLQDVPGAADAGYPDLEGVVTELRLIVAPPDLPEEVATYLRETVFEVMSSDAFAAWAETAERPIVPRDWEAATEVMLDQVDQMKVLVPELSS